MKLSIKSLLVAFPLGLMSITSIGQENLVPNPGFETIEGKMKALGCIENATGWTSPTGVRADLFTPSKNVTINVPENLYGKEDAKEGTNYAGIVGYSFGDAMPRSYIMGKLNSPLKKGMKYCVRFSLSLSESSKFASNQMGVNFSSKPYGTDSKTAIIEKTHVLDSKNKIFSAMYNWEEVCATYFAEGGEKFITLGNFTSNENTKNEKNKKDPKNKAAQITAAYYYIDDISVVLVAEDGTCDCGGSSSGDESYSNTIFQKVVNINEGMPVKDQIELQNEYFGFGKSKLLPNSMKSLDLIAEDLKANPNLKLEIVGHNDEMEEKLAAEKPAFSDMSNKRINEVIKYLTSKGIAESRLISNPVGISDPSSEISDIDEEDLRLAKNRRVSFKVR